MARINTDFQAYPCPSVKSVVKKSVAKNILKETLAASV